MNAALISLGRRPAIRRLLQFGRLLAIVAFLCVFGFTTGLMTVVLPPLAWIGVVGVTALVLLWVSPDLPYMPEKLLRRMFFLSVIVQFSTPVYYAVVVPGLPWISIRRVFWFPTVILAALMLAAYAPARQRIGALFRDARAIPAFGAAYFISITTSIFTSIGWTESIAAVWYAVLYWAMAFFACLLAVREEEDIRKIFRIFCGLALIAGPVGFAEFILQRHIITDLWPDVLMAQIMADSPQMFINITRDQFRNGLFRASFIYNVPLSYGEFLAVCAPLATFFVVYGRNSWVKILGAIAVICCILGVYASGSRGGYVGTAISVPMVVALWVIRHMKTKPNSMIGVIGAVSLLGFLMGFITLIFSWTSLRYKFTGGWEGAGSTNVRMIQWDMALPWILQNPITGYGIGVGSGRVGYVTESGAGTIDSYIITLLMESGVPGLIAFFGMMIVAILMLLRNYLTDPDPRTECAGALAAAITSFASYRLALSQIENHFFLFMLLALAVVQIAASRRRLIAVSGQPPAWSSDRRWRRKALASGNV